MKTYHVEFKKKNEIKNDAEQKGIMANASQVNDTTWQVQGDEDVADLRRSIATAANTSDFTLTVVADGQVTDIADQRKAS